MLRSFLLVYPFLIFYVSLATLLFVPVTWLTRDIRLLYWLARTGVRVALWLAGVQVEIVHGERAAEQPTSVFVCNHVSNLDPPVLFMTLPRIVVLLKESLGKIPLLGYVMGLGGFIFVNRQDRDSRKRAMEASVAALRRGISVLVFPEGTRSQDGTLLPFRPGPFSIALEAQAPIVPITIHGSRNLMPKGNAFVKPGRVTLVFHPPVPTAGMIADDRSALIARVRATMGKAITERSGK